MTTVQKELKSEVSTPNPFAVRPRPEAQLSEVPAEMFVEIPPPHPEHKVKHMKESSITATGAGTRSALSTSRTTGTKRKQPMPLKSPIAESALAEPRTLSCEVFTNRWRSCLRQFLLGTAFLSAYARDVEVIKSRWMDIFDVCQYYYNYEACLAADGQSIPESCPIFGHKALSGVVGGACGREVVTLMKKHSSCIAKVITNQTESSECLQTFLDFFKVTYDSLTPQKVACQRIPKLKTCLKSFALPSCDEEAQQALTMFKFQCMDTTKDLCGDAGSSFIPVSHTFLKPDSKSNAIVAVSPSFESCWDKQQALIGTAGIGDYLPLCEDNGEYSLIQCHQAKAECWCVDVKTGEEIENTRVKGDPQVQLLISECHTMRAKAAKEGGFEPACQNNGRFQPLQCDFKAEECWCVNESSGTEVPGTRMRKDQKLPDCGGKFGRKKAS
ncbi:unnamed protein product [Soboliphyme baturini]|uniref:Thyroglobulin type-1 domain-containing protein n=1 Tax=Soboliphyme baturini TaxID=241478 RepID=A0A183IQY4_9BILA|nr:unnamed protein product [Soboliphyme baturini]